MNAGMKRISVIGISLERACPWPAIACKVEAVTRS
jgi:hypothetical protein